MDVDILEEQGFGYQVAGQDLRAEMLASPGQIAQSGENLQMRRSTDPYRPLGLRAPHPCGPIRRSS